MTSHSQKAPLLRPKEANHWLFFVHRWHRCHRFHCCVSFCKGLNNDMWKLHLCSTYIHCTNVDLYTAVLVQLNGFECLTICQDMLTRIGVLINHKLLSLAWDTTIYGNPKPKWRYSDKISIPIKTIDKHLLLKLQYHSLQSQGEEILSCSHFLLSLSL